MGLEKRSYSMEIIKNNKAKPVEVSIIEDTNTGLLRQFIVKYKGGLLGFKEKEVVVLQKYLLKSILNQTLKVRYNELSSDEIKIIELKSGDYNLLRELENKINNTVETRELDDRRSKLKFQSDVKDLLETTTKRVALDKKYKELMSRHKTSKSGIIGAMGYKFAPLIFGYLYSVSIQNEFGDYELVTINEYLLDLYFRVDRNLTANETRMFSSYFSGYSSMVELKKMLEFGDRIRLVSRVSESEMKTHIEFLSKLNIDYSTSRSPIEDAVYGLP